MVLPVNPVNNLWGSAHVAKIWNNIKTNIEKDAKASYIHQHEFATLWKCDGNAFDFFLEYRFLLATTD